MAEDRTLSLRVSPALGRGRRWAVLGLIGMIVGIGQSVLSWLLIRLTGPPGVNTQDLIMLGSKTNFWWVPATFATFILAGVMSGLLARSTWAAAPFMAASITCGWAYAGTFISFTLGEWSQTLTWILVGICVALSPLAKGPPRTSWAAVVLLGLAAPMSLWLGRNTSLSTVGKLDMAAFQGLGAHFSDLSSEHTAYLGFFHWAVLMEAIAVAVGSALLLRRSGRARNVACVLVALIMAMLVSSNLWAVLFGFPYIVPFPSVDDSDLWMNPKYLLAVPLLVILLSFVQLAQTWAITRALARLGGPTRAQDLIAVLRRGTGDTGLDVLFWSPNQDSYVRADGMRTEPPVSVSAGSVSVQLGYGRSALIIPSDTRSTSALLSRLLPAIGLQMMEAREDALAQASLLLVAESRQRMAETALRDRTVIEQNLHDGAQQRLLALSTRLALLRTRVGADTREDVDAALDELREALSELRDLARGVHPAILSQRGLRSAVQALADRSPLELRTEVVDVRFEPLVEATVYFVICESVVNIVRHSGADTACVVVAKEEGRLTFSISDNGRGTASTGNGTGLVNMRDRVQTLGGALTIYSKAGSGTTVSGWLDHSHIVEAHDAAPIRGPRA